MILTYLLYLKWKEQNPGKTFLGEFSLESRLVYFFGALTTLAIATMPLLWFFLQYKRDR